MVSCTSILKDIIVIIIIVTVTIIVTITIITIIFKQSRGTCNLYCNVNSILLHRTIEYYFFSMSQATQCNAPIWQKCVTSQRNLSQWCLAVTFSLLRWLHKQIYQMIMSCLTGVSLVRSRAQELGVTWSRIFLDTMLSRGLFINLTYIWILKSFLYVGIW